MKHWKLKKLINLRLVAFSRAIFNVVEDIQLTHTLSLLVQSTGNVKSIQEETSHCRLGRLSLSWLTLLVGYFSTSLTCFLNTTYFCNSSSFPSPGFQPSLVSCLPFYSFSCCFLFLKQSTWGNEPYPLLCLLGAIFHTYTSLSPLSTLPLLNWPFLYSCSVLLPGPLRFLLFTCCSREIHFKYLPQVY